jgi:hypothetical protein
MVLKMAYVISAVWSNKKTRTLLLIIFEKRVFYKSVRIDFAPSAVLDLGAFFYLSMEGRVTFYKFDNLEFPACLRYEEAVFKFGIGFTKDR